MELLTISAVAFALSFFFALGGIGSAVLLIPVLTFLGIPFEIARPTGLFTNILSSSGGIINNLLHRRVDWHLAIPLTVSSVLFSPLGAYVSHLIPQKVVGIIFTLFLFYAGIMVYIPKRGGHKESYPFWLPYVIGSFAGFMSGLLGIGGGSLVSPLLLFYGLNPKKIISSVIVMVPFSSFTGFLTYWKLGSVDWGITLAAAIPSFIAGYIATHIAHKYLKPSQIKKLLGLLYFIAGIKFLFKWL